MIGNVCGVGVRARHQRAATQSGAGVEAERPLRPFQSLKRLRQTACLLWALPLLAVLPTRATIITNGSFENVTPSLSTNEICRTATSAYPYSVCSAAGWTGKYQIGNGATVGIFGASFNIPQPDPNGVNALILQGAGTSATQSIDIATTGSYTLSFYAANRTAPAGDNGPQTVDVSINNSVIQGGTYNDLPGAWTLETLSLRLNAGVDSLTFAGLDPSGGDVSAFIDDVSLSPGTAAPEPSSLLLIGAGFVMLATAIRLTRRRFE